MFEALPLRLWLFDSELRIYFVSFGGTAPANRRSNEDMRVCAMMHGA